MYRNLSTTATNCILLGLTALVVGVGIYIYPSLPATIASHWDASGAVNGYMPKFWGVFLFPLMMLGLFGVYIGIPYLEPFKQNLDSFRKEYNVFWIVLFIFVTYLFKLTVIWNYGGIHFDLGAALAPAIAVLYYTIGWVLPRTKRNWFIGIRTPWTLSSERVWEKTHRLGGTLFKISALGPLVAALWQGLGDIPLIIFVVGPVVVSALVTIVYSFLIFSKDDK